MKEKHLPYFAVLDACETKECPICFLVKDGIERYFNNLLYENINDSGFRKKFRKNFGFCNYHSYKFLSYNDTLAISLTHRDLLIDIIHKLKTGDIRYPPRKNTNKCIVCELIKEVEERYISVIIEYLDDEEFKRKFLASEGLCIPHYESLLAKMKSPPKWLVDFNIKRYKEILSRVDRYIDSCNFSLGDKRPILADNEKLIAKQVIRTLFGFEGNPK